jgi:hypothetical protein
LQTTGVVGDGEGVGLEVPPPGGCEAPSPGEGFVPPPLPVGGFADGGFPDGAAFPLQPAAINDTANQVKAIPTASNTPATFLSMIWKFYPRPEGTSMPDF